MLIQFGSHTTQKMSLQKKKPTTENPIKMHIALKRKKKKPLSTVIQREIMNTAVGLGHIIPILLSTEIFT